MRPLILTLLTLAVAPVPAVAQLSMRVGAGATLGNALISEAIVYDDVISLQTGVAPTVALALGYPVAPRYQLLVEARVASSGMTASTNAGEADLGSLRTIGVTLLAEGPMPYGMRFQLGGGVIKYSPAEATGVFLDDAPMKPMVTAGLGWTRSVRPGLALHLGARWDMHEFTTTTLRQRGWSQAQRINRLAFTIGLERGL
jgi:hypothetical protein